MTAGWGIQVIHWAGDIMSIRSWVVTEDTAAQCVDLLGEPSQEYLAPALPDGFQNRAEL